MSVHSLRIGELSRRTGVSPELLRAWERRYGLLDPARTGGGLRLYSPDDERRVRAMQAELERGISAAEAARLALAEPELGTGGNENALHLARERLTAALDDMDAEDAHAALDVVFRTFMVETVLSGVILPYLRDLGRRWEQGAVSIAQEHFASNLIRGRLLSLARGWERGGGRTALLACASRRAARSAAHRVRLGAAGTRLEDRLPRRRHTRGQRGGDGRPGAPGARRRNRRDVPAASATRRATWPRSLRTMRSPSPAWAPAMTWRAHSAAACWRATR